ncbi:MAG TPA: hypothetical protein VKT82_31710 [Ktedonobacterales bacterium]|nr:hypothetical protein [Ktedonobacterales bacterium]
MNNNLQNTLNKMIQSGAWSNPAMATLVNDYILYHVVLVVVGGLLALAFLLLSIFFWVRFKRTPKSARRTWPFEKKTYFAFGVLSAGVGLVIALIVVVDLTNVLDPHPGFALLVDSMGTPQAGTPMDHLYQAFNTWIQSGSTTIPSLVQEKIQERMAFHTTKAIVSGVLLVVFVVLGTLIWRTLLKKSRIREATWRLTESALLVCGAVAITFSLLLLVIVVANLQGAFAPITLTLLDG